MRTNRKRRRGITIVEFSVVTILCAMLIFGVVEFGRILMVKQVMDNAAREGARYAVVHTNNLATSDIQNYVTTKLAGQTAQLTGLTISVYECDPNTGANLGAWTNAAFGNGIAVQISGQFNPLWRRLFFLPASMTFTSTAVMYSEAN